MTVGLIKKKTLSRLEIPMSSALDHSADHSQNTSYL